MAVISIIFSLVVSAAANLIICGCHEVCLYIIGTSKKSSKAKKGLTIVSYICYAIIGLSICAGIFILGFFLCKTAVGEYIAVIAYTVLLALMATNEIYISPSVKVDSKRKAFRRGFTSASINNIIPNLHLKPIINIVYLIILICAQIEDLNLLQFNSAFSYFFTLNKYGIVIVFAIEKTISSIVSERKRKKILIEEFVEQERIDEQNRKKKRGKRRTLK